MKYWRDLERRPQGNKICFGGDTYDLLTGHHTYDFWCRPRWLHYFSRKLSCPPRWFTLPASFFFNIISLPFSIKKRHLTNTDRAYSRLKVLDGYQDGYSLRGPLLERHRE
jgi:hypothetical protein